MDLIFRLCKPEWPPDARLPSTLIAIDDAVWFFLLVVSFSTNASDEFQVSFRKSVPTHLWLFHFRFLWYPSAIRAKIPIKSSLPPGGRKMRQNLFWGFCSCPNFCFCNLKIGLDDAAIDELFSTQVPDFRLCAHVWGRVLLPNKHFVCGLSKMKTMPNPN